MTKEEKQEIMDSLRASLKAPQASPSASQTTEAPVSITFKLVYKGAEILATKRDLDAKIKPFLEDVKNAIDWAVSEDGKFTVAPLRTSGGFPKKEVQYVDGRLCPNCNGRLIKKVSQKGQNYIQCENGKYNFQTKQTDGCQFVEFQKPATVL